MATDARLVFCTFPDAETAARIGRALVEDKLAACMNIVPAVRSLYMWQGQVCDEQEVVALIKTTSLRFETLRARIVDMHPYDCPEVVAVAVDAGHAGYLEWVVQNTTD